MEKKTAVSILMPSLNVAKYIRQCLESVINQTEKNIEIICIDAGSTDGTLEILQEYAAIDSRIKIILSDKKSYGHQMNLGLDASTGEYIGIVETDDWIEADAFECLLRAAEENEADIVRANYYWYYTRKQPENKPYDNSMNCPYDTVFSPMDIQAAFWAAAAIWSGIYRKKLIIDNQIRFNETPGASFQDTSYYLMVCTVAERVFYLNRSFLHYRKDNENSSVNNSGKVYYICDEMRYYEKYLHMYPEKESILLKEIMAVKLDKYLWNYRRLAPRFQWEFLYTVREEFLQAEQNDLLDEVHFTEDQWSSLQEILHNPFSYYKKSSRVYAARPKSDALPELECLIQSNIHSPDITIVIPFYNSEEFLESAINSAREQSLQNIEIICIDDGSSDRSADIAISLANADSRISVFRQINLGQATARNRAVQKAKGRYLMFLDSDDKLSPDAAGKLLQASDEMDLDLLYFDGSSEYETEELQRNFPYYEHAYEYDKEFPSVVNGREYFTTAIEDNKYRVSPCMVFIRKQFLLENHISFDDGVVYEDNLFTFSCLMHADRVWHTKEQFYIRLVHGGSTMTQEKSIIHVYGFLTCVMKMPGIIQENEYDEAFIAAFNREYTHLINSTKNVYSQCKEKNGLNLS